MLDANVMLVSSVCVVCILCGCVIWVVAQQTRLIEKLSRLVMAERVVEKFPGLAVNLVKETVSMEEKMKEKTSDLKKTGVMVRVGPEGI